MRRRAGGAKGPGKVDVHSACQLADTLKPVKASREQFDAVSSGTYPRPGILFASVRLSYPQDEQKSDDTTLDLARQRVLVSGHGVMSSATSVPRTLELETADRPLWERSTVAPKTRNRGPSVEEYQGISASEGFNKVFLHGESPTWITGATRNEQTTASCLENILLEGRNPRHYYLRAVQRLVQPAGRRPPMQSGSAQRPSDNRPISKHPWIPVRGARQSPSPPVLALLHPTTAVLRPLALLHPPCSAFHYPAVPPRYFPVSLSCFLFPFFPSPRLSQISAFRLLAVAMDCS